MDSKYIKKRNLAMYRLRKKGSLLKEISIKYGISSERVRQVLFKMEQSERKKDNN